MIRGGGKGEGEGGRRGGGGGGGGSIRNGSLCEEMPPTLIRSPPCQPTII